MYFYYLDRILWAMPRSWIFLTINSDRTKNDLSVYKFLIGLLFGWQRRYLASRVLTEVHYIANNCQDNENGIKPQRIFPLFSFGILFPLVLYYHLANFLENHQPCHWYLWSVWMTLSIFHSCMFRSHKGRPVQIIQKN